MSAALSSESAPAPATRPCRSSNKCARRGYGSWGLSANRRALDGERKRNQIEFEGLGQNAYAYGRRVPIVASGHGTVDFDGVFAPSVKATEQVLPARTAPPSQAAPSPR